MALCDQSPESDTRKITERGEPLLLFSLHWKSVFFFFVFFLISSPSGPVDHQRAHSPATMFLSSFLLFTVSHFLAPLFVGYLPQVSAQKPGSRVSLPACPPAQHASDSGSSEKHREPTIRWRVILRTSFTFTAI